MDWGLYDRDGMMRQRYLAIDEQAAQVKDYLHHLRGRATDFFEIYDITWIYHENGLEGVVLTYPEIKSAVDNRIMSDVSLLPTYRDIKSQKRCIDEVRQKAQHKDEPITVEFLQQLHAFLLPMAGEHGIYRRDIPIHRTYFHEICMPSKIQSLLEQTLEYLNATHEAELHPIEQAANVHYRFMHVFPFTVHSGFIGRLLLSYVLMRFGGFPAVIHASDRQRYYEALRNGEVEFRSFLAEVLENSLDKSLRYFQNSERFRPKKAVS